MRTMRMLLLSEKEYDLLSTIVEREEEAAFQQVYQIEITKETVDEFIKRSDYRSRTLRLRDHVWSADVVQGGVDG